MYGQRVRVALSERLAIFGHLPRRSASVGPKRTPSEGPTRPRVQPLAVGGANKTPWKRYSVRPSVRPFRPSVRPSRWLSGGR